MKSLKPQNMVNQLPSMWKIFSYGGQTDKRKLTRRQESGGRERGGVSKLNIGREITNIITLRTYLIMSNMANKWVIRYLPRKMEFLTIWWFYYLILSSLSEKKLLKSFIFRVTTYHFVANYATEKFWFLMFPGALNVMRTCPDTRITCLISSILLLLFVEFQAFRAYGSSHCYETIVVHSARWRVGWLHFIGKR